MSDAEHKRVRKIVDRFMFMIVRSRALRGRRAYARIDAIRLGPELVGSVVSLPGVDEEFGENLARIDLRNMQNEAWAPVFLSRIRTRPARPR